MMVHLETVEARGAVERHAHCERCNKTFDYVIVRKTETCTFPIPALIRLAHKTCQEQLQKRLANDVEPVACPHCGWVTEKMMNELSRRFCKPLRITGWFLVAGGSLMALFGLALWLAGVDVGWIICAKVCGSMAAIGVLLVFLRRVLGNLRYSGRGFVDRSGIGRRFLCPQRAVA